MFDMTEAACANQPSETPTRELVHRLVHSFYDDVRASQSLGPIFDGVIGSSWPYHLDRMVEFWCTVMLGTHSFKGNVFGKHMAIPQVDPDHFLEWLSLWQRHTGYLFAGEALYRLRETAAGIARNLFYGYFGCFPSFRFEGDRAVEIVTI